jgi:hypothetical protein
MTDMRVTHTLDDNLRRFEEFRDWLLEQELNPRAGEMTPQALMELRLEVDRTIEWLRGNPPIN